MSSLIVLGVVAGGLFGAALVSKRRFGSLALALAAGSILSSLWANQLTLVARETGAELTQPPLEAVVGALLVLLPALLLLFRGPVQRSLRLRLVGAATFAALAAVFLLESLQMALVIDAASLPVYDFLAQQRAVIIAVGLTLAVFDLLLIKGQKAPK